MTTEKMLQEIQDKIGDKTLSKWCRILVDDWKWFYEKTISWIDDNINNAIDVKIIWHPISLETVLSAFDYKYKIIPLHDNNEYNYYIDTGAEKSIKRKLQTYLQDQSPETIKAIWEIVCK